MNIHAVDGTIVIVYLLAVLAFGLWVGRGQRNPADYSLGVAGLSAIAFGTDLYWPWYAAVGSLLTFFSGWLIHLFLPEKIDVVDRS